MSDDNVIKLADHRPSPGRTARLEVTPEPDGAVRLQVDLRMSAQRALDVLAILRRAD